jgi:hypothetical protein
MPCQQRRKVGTRRASRVMAHPRVPCGGFGPVQAAGEYERETGEAAAETEAEAVAGAAAAAVRSVCAHQKRSERYSASLENASRSDQHKNRVRYDILYSPNAAWVQQTNLEICAERCDSAFDGASAPRPATGPVVT